MIRGERFELDLGSDDEHDGADQAIQVPAAFVGDILERQPTSIKPPLAPTLKSRTGFPEHTKRRVQSTFRQQQRQNHIEGQSSPPGQSNITALSPGSWQQEEMARIDQENSQKLAAMSIQEIDQERHELMNTLSPSFIEKLMQRANKQSEAQMQRVLQQSSIDSGSNETDLSNHTFASPPQTSTVNIQTTNSSGTETSLKEPSLTLAAPNPEEPAPAQSQDTDTSALPHGTIHFPRAPQPPELDPSSDTFLDDLHEKYFPSLPADPEKLEWMQTTNVTNAYDADATALSPNQIRFSFKGELIPPRTAAEIPVTAGLHHHGDAPDSAGYTIPELAHLARSSFPAQRCISFQTLGRILYRLGKGEFGNPGSAQRAVEDESAPSILARELWGVVEREQVIELLVMESEGLGVDKGRHLSAKSYATEAIWLWQKGGGRRWKAS